jgi:hypothetical protein
MFNIQSVRDPRVRVPLMLSPEEITTLFLSVTHKKFSDGWPYRFRILPGNVTNRRGIAWLARYCENGGSSRTCQDLARKIFNEILPFTYDQFETAGFVDLAKSWRNTPDREVWRMDGERHERERLEREAVEPDVAEAERAPWEQEPSDAEPASQALLPVEEAPMALRASFLHHQVHALLQGLSAFWRSLWMSMAHRGRNKHLTRSLH